MTFALVVETSSVTVTNSSFQNYTHPDDHTRQTTDTPGFKPFVMNQDVEANTWLQILKREDTRRKIQHTNDF